MSLSTKTQNILKVAMANKAAAAELSAAIAVDKWATVALEVAGGSAPSAAFSAALAVGDICQAVSHTTGAVTFAAVATAGVWPVSLTITSGDLISAQRNTP
jgi:hypothetical protein